MEREEWFEYFEDIYRNDYLYIFNIGYFDYRKRRSTEGKNEQITQNSTFHFITGGKGYFVYNGKTHHLKEGDVFCFPSKEPFAFYPDDDDPWRYYWFNVMGDGAKELRERIGINKAHPWLHTEKMDDIKKKLDELLDGNFNYGEFYYRALSTFYHIISLLVKNEETTSKLNIVSQAKKLILSNYNNDDFNIASVHKSIHVSEPYLRKLFKRETGETLSAFLINCRLSRAGMLLRYQDYSIRELCYLVGYKDDVYFIREFKKKFGVTPKKYRQLAIKKEI